MPLAENNEPLRLADGRLIYPGGVIPTESRNRDVDASPVAVVRRKLADLPADTRQMNAIGVVLAYVLFGLDDEAISEATRIPTDQIGRIKLSDPYIQLHSAIVRTVLDTETDVVREFLTKNARRAATTMVDALDAGTRSDRMAAARDILDRSGLRPADVVEHRHRMDGGLVIEIVRRDEHEKLPVIDVRNDQ